MCFITNFNPEIYLINDFLFNRASNKMRKKIYNNFINLIIYYFN